MDSYIALIHPPETPTGPFGVTFPDLDGCISAGATRTEAIERAAEALGGHIAAMLSDGDHIPPPRDWLTLQADIEVQSDVREGAEPCRIPVRPMQAPKQRINIMVARDSLRRIDQAAARRGVNRSAFIEAAALRAAGVRDG